MKGIDEVKNLLTRVEMNCMGIQFNLRVEEDVLGPGRIFIQVQYEAPCTKTGVFGVWSGRKYYLSQFMTDDEVIKTAYTAFESAVRHEVMEGFKVDEKILFNPHINFEELLAISDREIQRQ